MVNNRSANAAPLETTASRDLIIKFCPLREANMNDDPMERIRQKAATAAKFFENYSDEQIEAICDSAVTYRPKCIMDKINSFKRTIDEATFQTMFSAPWFLMFLEQWDEEQKERNTEALVEALVKVVPTGSNITRENIAAYLELKSLSNE